MTRPRKILATSTTFDNRAQQGIAEVDNKAAAADQKALAAGQSADQANQNATQASNRVTSLAGTVENLDNYKQVGDTTISQRRPRLPSSWPDRRGRGQGDRRPDPSPRRGLRRPCAATRPGTGVPLADRRARCDRPRRPPRLTSASPHRRFRPPGRRARGNGPGRCLAGQARAVLRARQAVGEEASRRVARVRFRRTVRPAATSAAPRAIRATCQLARPPETTMWLTNCR